MNVSNKRWGNASQAQIDETVSKNVPQNTERNKKSMWKQFMDFCSHKKFEVSQKTNIEAIANILKDYAYNMRKLNGDEYKESVIKTIWNSIAKMLQEKFFADFKIKFDPFHDIEFIQARCARDAKRKQLQKMPDKRKHSAVAFNPDESTKMKIFWKEDNPEGLQKKFFNVAATELAWRGNEGAFAETFHFNREIDNFGEYTGRIEYNPIFTKTTQGGASRCADSKWLTKNSVNPYICPVRLFNKLLAARPKHVTTNKLFLTPNPHWEVSTKGWYKNCPVGINELSKWTKMTAKSIGIDVQNKKVTNHSHRSTAVTQLANAGIAEQQLMKITGHANSNSLQPYLTMQSHQHQKILDAMRGNEQNEPITVNSTSVSTDLNAKTEGRLIFQNCSVNIQNFNC